MCEGGGGVRRGGGGGGGVVGNGGKRRKEKGPVIRRLTISLPKANLTKPRKLLHPELSNET